MHRLYLYLFVSKDDKQGRKLRITMKYALVTCEQVGVKKNCYQFYVTISRDNMFKLMQYIIQIWPSNGLYSIM